ncbi:hypothetical protein LXL04_012888 [Taraxacum kok-saghyz]
MGKVVTKKLVTNEHFSCSGCKPWIFIPDRRITEICIRSGNFIDSIRFTYIDHDHLQKHSETYGGDGGTPHNISFAYDEYITEICGTVGVFLGMNVVTSISFGTNNGPYGSYGKHEGSSFSFQVTQGKFVGFCGISGRFLNSIGSPFLPYYSG